MSSLFGANTQSQPSGSGLFGNLNQGNNTNASATAAPSLFGGATANTNTQPAASSLFGNKTNAPAQATGGSLFGNTANAGSGTSLFGNTAVNSASVQPAGNSLFGGNTTTTQQQPGGLFSNPLGSTNRPAVDSALSNPALTNTASMLQSGLGGSQFGSLGQVAQTELAKSRLAQINIDSRPNEKSIPERIQSLIRKWDPNSQETLLQDYTYNAVNAAYAPFYYKNAEETEKEWEEALARKPANIETKDGETVSFIPVLVRGFHALGQRAEVQARTVNEMRVRLHEMNNSLTAVMSKHQQTITVQLDAARRQHSVLSQRCLRLAVKVQVLRNRGYALDAAEEQLRKTLQSLEKQVFDPAFTGREEEIWARMVTLRERTRWLEEEGQRLGQQADEQNRQGVPEEVINKTKKILRDYDGQLLHLEKELEEVKKEFAEWQDSRKASKR